MDLSNLTPARNKQKTLLNSTVTVQIYKSWRFCEFLSHFSLHAKCHSLCLLTGIIRSRWYTCLCIITHWKLKKCTYLIMKVFFYHTDSPPHLHYWILLLKESVVVTFYNRTKSVNRICWSDKEFLNVEGGFRPACAYLKLQFEGPVSMPYGGQTVSSFGCFNPENRTCRYVLDGRQGVPHCLSAFGSEETINRWISIIRILLSEVLNDYSHSVYNPVNTTHVTNINSYMFRHRGAIVRECYNKDVHANLPIYWQVCLYM